MYKKLIALCASMMLAGAALAGCSSAQQESPAAPQDDYVANVVTLKGPTGMSMAQLYENPAYSITVANSPQEVVPAIAQAQADIAAVPANLASVLYNNTQHEVQVLAVNTLGVLYVVERGDTVQSFEDLKGKTVYASGKGAVPEYVMQYLLKENGIDPDTDISLDFKSEHTEVLSALMSDPQGIALMPQPFVTVAQSKDPNIRVALDLNAEWNKVNPDSKLITGVVVARKAFIEEHPAVVDRFMKEYKESIDFCNKDAAAAATIIGEKDILAAPVAEKALPHCNLHFIQGKDLKRDLSGYLAVLHGLNPKSVGGELPGDDFYYAAS